METRPGLAREEDEHKVTPMHMAAQWDKIDVLRVLLEHDWSLGYVLTSNGTPILASVASRGYVGAARELLKHCPDAPYALADGTTTCLHQAVQGGHMELLQFFLGSKHLRKLVNMRDIVHETPLHDAVRKCNPKIVKALLQHPDTDVTVLNDSGNPATWVLSPLTDHAKTLNWVLNYFLLDLHCFSGPLDYSSLYNTSVRSLDDVYIHYIQIQYNNISLNICFKFSSYYKSMFLIFSNDLEWIHDLYQSSSAQCDRSKTF